MSLKAFHIVFIIFSTLLALGTGVWCLWVNFVAGAPIYVAGAAASFVVAIVLDGLWRLVLQENETAAHLHMKRVARYCWYRLCLPRSRALACPFCYGAKDGKSTEHMAVAIWFLFGAVMSVIGGIGAFSFHLWRHGRMPVEPHQELTEEDLSKYE